MIWGQKGNNLCKRDIPDGHSRCTGAVPTFAASTLDLESKAILAGPTLREISILIGNTLW